MGDADSRRYRVNEIFYSLQGEGQNAGVPMLFVRFAGCNLACDFCDTKHDDPVLELSRDELVKLIEGVRADRAFRWICLTGGEPLLQIDEDLVQALKGINGNGGRPRIAVESNGSILNRAVYVADWFTVSPKGRDVKMRYASEVKLVWPNHADLMDYCLREIEASYYYLQPLAAPRDLIISTTMGAIEEVKRNPRWALSVQLQKSLGFK